VPGNRGGESETIIGNWLKRGVDRQKVVIATKVGSEMGPKKKGLAKQYILRAVGASLKRLQTDYIDLYQSHFDDTDTPLEETLEAYAQLIKQGKVKASAPLIIAQIDFRRHCKRANSMDIPDINACRPYIIFTTALPMKRILNLSAEDMELG
jgi:aryl-alcohol dehydrogenase-like predicted oxidoreductase